MMNHLDPGQRVLMRWHLRCNGAVNVLKGQLRKLLQIFSCVRAALPGQQVLSTLNKLPELFRG
ncbi:hypothetical protein D3C75_590200 [compost metagenome]